MLYGVYVVFGESFSCRFGWVFEDMNVLAAAAGVSGVLDSRWRMWPYFPNAIREFSRE